MQLLVGQFPHAALDKTLVETLKEVIAMGALAISTEVDVQIEIGHLPIAPNNVLKAPATTPTIEASNSNTIATTATNYPTTIKTVTANPVVVAATATTSSITTETVTANKSSFSEPAIVGIAAGVPLGICALAGAGYFFRRQRLEPNSSKLSSPDSVQPTSQSPPTPHSDERGRAPGPCESPQDPNRPNNPIEDRPNELEQPLHELGDPGYS
ncbi:hypothetical protein MMC20_001046 [Loxospora ochrophaea]|nr:hypothetical protein [Loxospora ochrophaea]